MSFKHFKPSQTKNQRKPVSLYYRHIGYIMITVEEYTYTFILFIQ